MLFILVIKYFVGEDSKRMKDGDWNRIKKDREKM